MLNAGDDGTPPALRPAELVNVSTSVWQDFRTACEEGTYADAFARSWTSGREFATATDGLRDRPPIRVEWKGDHRPVGYETVPVDLRIDHVFLVSCKDDSHIVYNGGPRHLFDRRLAERIGDTGDWFLEVDASGYQGLYAATRRHLGADDLPIQCSALTVPQREFLKGALAGSTWPVPLRDVAAEFFRGVAARSAERWRQQVPSKAGQELMYWRLVRLASGPYFLLGTAGASPVRLRIGTPWDFRQAFEFLELRVEPDLVATQAVVHWTAEVRHRASGDVLTTQGHVEVRWSKGKFRRAPEAKVYLDTPHSAVPGYFPLL